MVHNELRCPAGEWDTRVAVGWTECVHRPGAGIMEADDHQVTTVFTVQPSFHHRHSEYYEALPSSANVQSHLTSSFDDDGNAS